MKIVHGKYRLRKCLARKRQTTAPARFEITLPCHPSQRVAVERGTLETACPDCERPFVVASSVIALS